MKRSRADNRGEGPQDRSVDPQPGLVELIVIALPDDSSTAPVADAIRNLVSVSSIRALDLVLVSTDATGMFTVLELEEVAGLASLRDIDGEVGGWLSSDDIALVCDALPPRSTALLLVTEDVWATLLADAVQACGGQIVGGERIPARRVGPRVDAPGRGGRA